MCSPRKRVLRAEKSRSATSYASWGRGRCAGAKVDENDVVRQHGRYSSNATCYEHSILFSTAGRRIMTFTTSKTKTGCTSQIVPPFPDVSVRDEPARRPRRTLG